MRQIGICQMTPATPETAAVWYQVRIKNEDGGSWADISAPRASKEEAIGLVEDSTPWPGYKIAVFPVFVDETGNPIIINEK